MIAVLHFGRTKAEYDYDYDYDYEERIALHASCARNS